MKEVLNMFENLKLKEPFEAFNQAPDIIIPLLNPEAADANYKAERVESREEDFVAFYLLLLDLNKFRDEVSTAWENYNRGVLDLVTASITTNTAVELARTLEENCSDQFTKPGGTEIMLPMFFNAHALDPDTGEMHKERPEDEFNFKTYDTADFVFWPAFIILFNFCRIHKPGQFLELPKEYVAGYDPTSDRSKKSEREQFK